MSAGTSSGGFEPGCCTVEMMAPMMIFFTSSFPCRMSVCSIWPALSASWRSSRPDSLRAAISALLSMYAFFSGASSEPDVPL